MRRANGWGTIRRLTDSKRRNPWVAYTPQTKTEKRHVLGTYRTKAEAMEALEKYLQKPYSMGDHSTFADIFPFFLEYNDKGVKRGKQSISSYKAAFNRCSILHDREIKDIKLSDYQNIINDMADNVSRSTMVNVVYVLKGVSAYAYKHDLIPSDITENIEFRPTKEQKPKEPFTDAELTAIFNAVDCIEKDVITIMLYMGWRVNELLMITPENVDIKERTIQSGLKTNAGKNRVVPVNNDVWPIVERYYKAATAGQRLFKTNKNIVNAFVKPLTGGKTSHTCRHTFATTMFYVVKAPERVINALGGWENSGKNMNTRELKYTHETTELLSEWINKLHYPQYTRSIEMCTQCAQLG